MSVRLASLSEPTLHTSISLMIYEQPPVQKKKQLTENPLFLDPAKHQPVSAPAVRAQSVGQRVEVGAKVYRIEGLS